MRLFHFLGGILVCAYKGTVLPFLALIPGTQTKEYLLKDWFGFADPGLEPEWARFGKGEAWTHVATNIVVEWVRLNPQRASKTACALITIPQLIRSLL